MGEACSRVRYCFALSAGSCSQGWEGSGCSMCTTDAVCISSSGNTAATCNRDLAYSPLSRVKTYTCNATGPSLIMGLIDPNSLAMQCHTGLLPALTPESEVSTAPTSHTQPPAGRRLAATGSATGNASYCVFSFWIASPAIKVSCSINSCGIQPGSSKFTCDTTLCQCINDTSCGNDGKPSFCGECCVCIPGFLDLYNTICNW